MSPYAALLATVLVATSSTTGVNAQFDVRSLGHHAHAALTQLSHLPEIVGLVNPQGEIETSTVAQDKRSLWARYYGDSRGFSQREFAFLPGHRRVSFAQKIMPQPKIEDG